MTRIPQTGDDGLHRLDCPYCGRLFFRFDTSLKGGPLELKCWRSDCKKVSQVWFGVGGPEWT